MADIRILALFGARVVFGQERANLETLAALQENGCAVLCVIRPEEWPEIMELRRRLDGMKLAWTTAPYMDYPVKGWLLHTAMHNTIAYRKANRALHRICDEFRPTHIHAFNPFYIASFYGSLKRLNIPLVYRAGDEPVLHNSFYRRLWDFIKRRSSHFVADSQFIKQSLENTGIPSERISIIYAPPPRRTAGSPVEIPPSAQSQDAFRFVFVGQIAPHKGVGILLHAFKDIASRHPNAHLLLAGPLSDAWAKRTAARISEDHSISPSIHFLGLVERIPDLLAQGHVHVAPSLVNEGYGLVVIEAKSAAIPSVVFTRGALSELIEHEANGIVVESTSHDALAHALESYLLDPALTRKHGAAALQSLKQLGTRAFPERWLNIYRDSIPLEQSIHETNADQASPHWAPTIRKSPTRILALFGARVIFGQERANIETLAALQAQGFDVLCLIRDEQWPELMKLRKLLTDRGLKWETAPYLDYPIRGWYLYTLVRNPAAWLVGNRKLLSVTRAFKPTHIHAFNSFYVASFLPFLAWNRLPMVYRVGETPPLHNAFYKLVWKFIGYRCSRFVASSKFIAQQIVDSGISPSKVSVIYTPPPGRPVSGWDSSAAPLKAPNELAIAYAGQISAAKGVEVLIEAFDLLTQTYPHAHLYIAGPAVGNGADQWSAELYEKVIQCSKLKHRVRFCGYIEDIHTLMRSCDVHVAPSIRDEGYGLVVVEAKSAGRPSIIFPSGGMPELVTDGTDGFVTPDKTAESLVAALRRYIETPDLIELHGRAALKSLDRLGINEFSSRWRAAYDSVPPPS